MNIAWIGTGIMGKNMAYNLKNNGHNIKIYNRTWEKSLLQEKEYGFKACKSIIEAIEGVEIIFTMLGYPSDVEKVYLGEQGILKNIKSNNVICIDMTTSSPKLAKKINDEFSKKNINVLDAPVSGGDVGAKNATLSIMVGGNFDTYNKVVDLLKIMGNNINYIGDSGFGQHAKMCNQIVIAGNIASVCESLYYCHTNKINPLTVLKSIETGAAQSWQLTNNFRKIINNDYEPGFFIKHFVKDMNIIVDELGSTKLPILQNVLNMYNTLLRNNMGEYGTQALIYYYLNN